MTTWKKLITDSMECLNDSWDNVESCTLSEDELLVDFDDDYECHEEKPFALWTKTRVYFPACYDGAEWIVSVPRWDCKPTQHVG